MSSTATFKRSSAAAASAREAVCAGDDKAMLKAAAALTRDLNSPSAGIYWGDLLGSAFAGYAALAAAILLPSAGLAILSGLIAVLALYRAGSFIHELTHLKPRAVPGFRTAWNLIIGIPLLVPSFMYEGVHNQHHAKPYYGTADDPEYLPLALMHPWTLPMFLVAAVLAPVGLLIRFALLAPLSLLSPRLRETVVAKYSGLQINPRFRRPFPEGDLRRDWILLEIACSVWAIALIALTATGIIPLKAFLIFLGVASGVMFLNQVRTLVAHLWENEGEPMNVTAQYLDSVNVPPPATLPIFWAPVGLRYHALGTAHRRLCAALEQDSIYHESSHRGLSGLVVRLAATSWRRR
jgi:hypothetical protein